MRAVCVLRLFALIFVCGFCAIARSQSIQTLRVAAYNIDADVNGISSPNNPADGGIETYQVLEGIGEQLISGVAQPLDILALEETVSNTATVDPIVTNLNNYYAGAAVYARSPVQGTNTGLSTNGGGPNAMVYNTKTLQLIDSVGVGNPSGFTAGPWQGEFRQVMRYEFQPVGGSSANDFYVYVTHMKSTGSDTGSAYFSDESLRNEEATIIRNDAATLPSNASILYMGDFNLSGTALVTSGNKSLSAYQTMTAASPTPGQAFDPLNPTLDDTQIWADNPNFTSIMTESANRLLYRDDLQLMTSNVYHTNGDPNYLGLQYVQGSEHPFGNNGSIDMGDSVNSPSNTALEDLVANAPIDAATLLSDLTVASDHLPIVADYTILVPEPPSLLLMAAGMLFIAIGRAKIRKIEKSEQQV